ncbi:substrate-binding domain-containing protein [Methylophaga sp. OBS3]|uniref:substrate-binding domain-containing protein n=1 Tax=Methylophaga sp. OBS3 TaxID=2991934 RepID=UPI00225A0C8C|nr:substrate-binding domain-containing protein [Methylophaga sp. OBS3]MCX4190520.1 hypothetical protein [Methylophaga sp. OBS3]
MRSSLSALARLTIVSLVLWTTACSHSPQFQTSNTIRLAVVNTPQDSGLIDYLLADFTTETGYQVNVYSGSDVFERALDGQADLVIAHYGKSGMQEFVQSGFGSWPKMVFANQVVLIGPISDPANVAEADSLEQALTAIQTSHNKLLANNNHGVEALTNTIMAMLNTTATAEWFIDDGVSNSEAIEAAEKHQAYVIWGAVPFLKYQETHASAMRIIYTDDAVLQRIMAITRVLDDKRPINRAGAQALEAYLLRDDIQAKVLAYRMADIDSPLWWPAARHN